MLAIKEDVSGFFLYKNIYIVCGRLDTGMYFQLNVTRSYKFLSYHISTKPLMDRVAQYSEVVNLEDDEKKRILEAADSIQR